MAFVISERMTNQSSPPKGNVLLQNVLPVLYRYCLSLTGSVWDAEDLVQTTILHMLQSEKNLHEVENEEAYLIRSARNRWIDHIRRQNAQKRLSAPDEKEFSRRHEEPSRYCNEEYTPDLELALQYLSTHVSPWQRTILVLRDVWGFTGPETAELLDTTEGAVKAALSRARALLAQRHREGYKLESVSIPVLEGEREWLKAYLAAFRIGDVQRWITLSLNDATEPIAIAGSVLYQRFYPSGTLINSHTSHDIKAMMVA
ncbi:RNA polymerase subunit sigma [Paenibacillus kribbensis]|uniref:RNA polymerase subunit sigma n=1 Tax=Paenibacillus kribbensis TaxID=172713 RepID=A0A222WKC3_9BACL|nr:RNA polymerase sigma factor [Paenibacillus kribbensis]ASR46428.1 RNA polymerase subunit sigma [Paenibacillus kribbensis]